MKCISCESEINPKWKHAVDSNICPFCGDSIMDENLRDLFSSLNNCMQNLQNYQEQLDDWMLSNFNYIKTNSPNLIKFVPKEELREASRSKKQDPEPQESKKFTVKVTTEHGEQEVEAEKIQPEEKTHEFFQRAEAIKPGIDGFHSATEKTEHLKKIAQQIKRAGNISRKGSSSEDSFMNMMDDADPEAVEEMQSLLSGNEIASSLDHGDDDEIPSFVLNMANKSKGHGGQNQADLIKLHQMQERMSNSRKNFESGENRGRGGFSRS